MLLNTDTIERIISIIDVRKKYKTDKHNILVNRISLSMEYINVLNAFHNDINVILRIINGYHILDDTFLIEECNETIFKPDYIYRSQLWRGKHESKEITDVCYKGRFITYMLLSIDLNIDKILVEELEYCGDKGNKEEAIELIYQIRECIAEFIRGFTSKKPQYYTELNKLYELMTVVDDDYVDTFRKSLKVSKREIENIKNMLKPDVVFDSKKPEDYILIQNICLLAYIITTGKKNVKDTFIVPKKTTTNDTNRLRSVIESLGMCISNVREIEYTPILYDWYIQSLPKNYYRFKDINFNADLAEGCRALSYLYFYSNDKTIQKFIANMIYRKG